MHCWAWAKTPSHLLMPLQRADTVELTIGYHLLEGKMVDLKKPFAILEKHSTPVDVDAMEEDGHPQCNTEYKVCSLSR